MKRYLAMLLVFALFLGLLPAVTLASEPIVLKVWGGVPAEYGPQQTMDAFNEAYKDKGIQAEYVRFVNDATGNIKLETTLLTGGEIDLFMSYGQANLVKRGEAGMALEIGDMLQKAEFDISKELGNAATKYVYDGKVWGLPTKVEYHYLMANVDMFEAAGIPLPLEGWDYEEFREVSKKLTHGEGQDKVYGMFWDTASAGLLAPAAVAQAILGDNWMYKEDGSSNYDNEYIVRAFELAEAMMNEDGSCITHTDSVTQNMSIYSTFVEGKAAMSMGVWAVRNLKDLENYPHDFVTAFIPAPVADKEKAIYEPGDSAIGDILSISGNTKYPEEALEFMLWYIRGGMLPMLPYGRIPLYTGIPNEQTTKGFMQGAEGILHEESISRYLEVKELSLSTKTTKRAEMDKILSEEVEALFSGRKDAKTAMADAKARADAILAE